MKNKKFVIVKICLTVVTILTLAAIFTFLAVSVCQNKTLAWDQACLQWLQNNRTGSWQVFFRICSHLVNPILIAVIGFVLLLAGKRQRNQAILFFMNVALIALINLMLKNCFLRSRPDAALSLVNESGYSFPSGHAMGAVAIYGFLIYWVWQTRWRRCWQWLATVGNVLLILLVGFSRIYLGAHYCSDVLAGYCAAGICLLLFLILWSCCRRLQPSHSFVAGFYYALTGIWQAFQKELNLMVQFSCLLLVIIFGACLQIAAWEWCVVLILSFMVLALELVNTALEAVCDKITTEHDSQIKFIKDVAAGAVLLMAICAVIIAGIIFLPKMIGLFYVW